MERPTLDCLRDALSDDAGGSPPDLWPAIRARLAASPGRPLLGRPLLGRPLLGRPLLGNSLLGRWGAPAGFAFAAAVLLVLIVGGMTSGGANGEDRLDLQVIDVRSPDGPAGDAAREEAARLLDAQRPTFLDDVAPAEGRTRDDAREDR